MINKYVFNMCYIYEAAHFIYYRLLYVKNLSKASKTEISAVRTNIEEAGGTEKDGR
jgi:hypothetical protein